MYDMYQTPAKEMYLAEMGWHFNEKACKYAVQYLKDRNGKPIKPYSKEANAYYSIYIRICMAMDRRLLHISILLEKLLQQ
jgi:phage-related protein